MQTIFALATARGKAGVAIIRISGVDAFDVGRGLVGSLPEPGANALKIVRDTKGNILDHALVIVFQGPASFTGEDVVELHLHGSVAVVRSVERAISDIGLARHAEAGEFTQRALLDDKLDLAQVEGLGDLINAETEAQRVQALCVFSGKMGEKTAAWRRNLLRCAALLEATIDFVDEDVPVDVLPEVLSLVSGVDSELRSEVAGSYVAERVRDGFEVAIIGAPNAGKSTLLNALAGREIAITSEVAGTTRDVIEARLDVNGLPVTFLDTAGLRSSDDRVEQVGIERAVDRALSADLRILLKDDSWERHPVLSEKIDLSFEAKADEGEPGGISGLTGKGVDEFLQLVGERLSDRASTVRTAMSERQRSALSHASTELGFSNEVLSAGGDYEIAAEHIRAACRCLDSMLGRVDVEDILGEIFSNFCVGK